MITDMPAYQKAYRTRRREKLKRNRLCRECASRNDRHPKDRCTDCESVRKIKDQGRKR